MGAYQAAILERHPIGRGELQIRQRFRRLGSGANRLGEAGPVNLRKLLETGAAAGGDVVRGAVGTEKPLRVVFVERHKAREPARDSRMAGKRGVFGLRQFEPLAQSRHGSRHGGGADAVEGGESRSPIASNCGLTPSFYKGMTVKAQIVKVFQQEDLNFLLTNRIPRRLATQFMGWFSRIEQPLVRDLSIAAWRLFSDLDLARGQEDAVRKPSRLLYSRTQGRRPPDRAQQ